MVTGAPPRCSAPIPAAMSTATGNSRDRPLVGDCLVVRISGFVCVVRAAHERARFDVNEAQLERHLFELAEFVGMVVTDHRSVSIRWAEILADRQNSAAGLAK